uniref:Macaca fascicularis brain cDNA clone: QorA-13058, similar to human beta-carotene dioxygenase 2 (BCDO2), mRNA, RefSeq: NM_031938.2 n=1 Tax=Macaca fascicularis TaxID=9541 RepID=I7G9S6_MACFA|nr:unnamed protein product [Macaca fascicularis]
MRDWPPSPSLPTRPHLQQWAQHFSMSFGGDTHPNYITAKSMLEVTKAIESSQLTTGLLSNAFFGTYRFGEKMVFIPQNLFLFQYQEPMKKMVGLFFLW